MSQESDGEPLPPEIIELNEILAKMISGQNVKDQLTKSYSNIQQKSLNLLLDHSIKEKQAVTDRQNENRRRINLIFDSTSQILGLGNGAGPSLIHPGKNLTIMHTCSGSAGHAPPPQQPSNGNNQQDNSTPSLMPAVTGTQSVDQPSTSSQPAPPPAAVRPVLRRKRGRPRKYSPETGTRNTAKPKKKIGYKVITKLPKRRHGFNCKKLNEGFFCICGQQLSSKCNLRRHIKLQTQKAKPFKCSDQDCDKTFISLNLLKKHQMVSHQIGHDKGTIGCTDCGKVFANQLLHRRHRMTCHTMGRRQRTLTDKMKQWSSSIGN